MVADLPRISRHSNVQRDVSSAPEPSLHRQQRRNANHGAATALDPAGKCERAGRGRHGDGPLGSDLRPGIRGSSDNRGLYGRRPPDGERPQRAA